MLSLASITPVLERTTHRENKIKNPQIPRARASHNVEDGHGRSQHLRSHGVVCLRNRDSVGLVRAGVPAHPFVQADGANMSHARPEDAPTSVFNGTTADEDLGRRNARLELVEESGCLADLGEKGRWRVRT